MCQWQLRNTLILVGLNFLLQCTIVQAETLFDGGEPDGVSGTRIADSIFIATAADFSILGSNTTVTSAEVWTSETDQFDWNGTLNYYFFADGGGRPVDLPLYQGVAVNVSKESDPSVACLTGSGYICFKYSFEFQSPISLDSGTVYWFALSLEVDDPEVSNTQAFWASTGTAFLEPTALTHDSTFASWDVRFPDAAFRLNGDSALDVTVDIKPRNKSNKINRRSRGKIWVAVLSSTDFDPLQVDVSTARFGPDEAIADRHRVRDVNRDGMGDLLLRFKIRDTGIACADTTAALIGVTHNGRDFIGLDTIKVVKCR